MKRLVFCFDGSWNKLDAVYPTNVVLTAESVLPLASDGTAQVVFYDEGVGTDKNESFRGGAFGAGLVKNLADGYRFLIFNFSPGDEIYIFGFSRGAYTARSFAGLLNTCGVMLRKDASKVGEAIDLYKMRDKTDAYKERMLAFRRDHSPYVVASDEEEAWRGGGKLLRLAVTYIGVWDTVGALGIPARYAWFSWINKKHQFHDADLSPFVMSARHAVAIDERRLDFAPTRWENIDELNARRGKQTHEADAPYQQVWFPGVHGSVGGGGERRGLSDQTLEWVLDGARAAGLVLDTDRYSRVFEHRPDYREFIDNSAKNGLLYKAMNAIAAGDRSPGPATLYEISVSTKRRWLDDAKNLKGGLRYRPGTLKALAEQLDKLDPREYGLGPVDENAAFKLYEVKPGDTLGAIAKAEYGNAALYPKIYDANRHQLDDPNRIYPGQMLRVPPR